MSQLADYPILVDRTDALEILGVTASTFDRLCREGRFADWGGPGLFRSAELRAYRAADRRRIASVETGTNAKLEPSKTADLSVTPPAQIVAGAQNGTGQGNGTLRHCEGCRREFQSRRADARSCSPTCRKRASRRRCAGSVQCRSCGGGR